MKGALHEMLTEVRTEKYIQRITDFVMQAIKEENSEEDLEAMLSEEQIIRLV